MYKNIDLPIALKSFGLAVLWLFLVLVTGIFALEFFKFGHLKLFTNSHCTDCFNISEKTILACSLSIYGAILIDLKFSVISKLPNFIIGFSLGSFIVFIVLIGLNECSSNINEENWKSISNFCSLAAFFVGVIFKSVLLYFEKQKLAILSQST